MSGTFSHSYHEARDRFRGAIQAADAEIISYRNDVGLGPESEDLCTDVAWLGPRSATKVVFAVSGTHGVEGYCGSACQLSLLAGDLVRTAPADTAFLLVHALNPYGFAYDRRVNEDNVDLNRNFIDHHNPPVNDRYGEVHPPIVPSGWEGDARLAADTALMETAAARGMRYLQSAITGGQWTHPDGLFYGGNKPVWSHWVLREVAGAFLPGRKRVAYIDLHTGLGERAAGETIFRGGRDEGAYDRASAWYGGQAVPVRGWQLQLDRDCWKLGEPRGRRAERRRGAHRDHARVRNTSGPGGAQRAARRQLAQLAPRGARPASRSDQAGDRDAFCPPETEWRQAVLARARAVFAQALAGLAAS